jgi:hypothetical protein
MGWEPSKGSQTLPRWCAAGKPAGSPRAWQQWTDKSDGRTLPSFVTDELHAFLGCGILARGLAQLFCPTCHERYVVAWSCKGRGFCPSCGGRRMNAGALTLVDHVLPEVPIRQFATEHSPFKRHFHFTESQLQQDVR